MDLRTLSMNGSLGQFIKTKTHIKTNFFFLTLNTDVFKDVNIIIKYINVCD